MARVILKEKKSPNRVSKNRWDDWVPQDRVRKLTPENRELAAQLHNQMKKNLQESKGPKSTGKGGKGGRTNGSDFGSGRGSEERGSAAVQGGRVRRGPRDYDLEHVSTVFFIVVFWFGVRFAAWGKFWLVCCGGKDLLSKTKKTLRSLLLRNHQINQHFQLYKAPLQATHCFV